MKLVRIMLLTVCIAIFFEKETGIFMHSVASSEKEWNQMESTPTALKETPPKLLPAFHSYHFLNDVTGTVSPSAIQFGNRQQSPGTKIIALTFDDGPHPKITKKILDILDRHNAKATFFMVGERVQYYPKTVQDVFSRGHEIGNHTWNHGDLSKLEIEEIEKEISTTNEAIQRITGNRPTLFRPPYGSLPDPIRRQVDMTVALWSADTFDWKYKDADLLLKEVTDRAHDQAVVLMHDIYPSTADGLEQVLQYLEGEGYTFVTVSELFALKK